MTADLAPPQTPQTGTARGALAQAWYLAALLACLSVAILNGGPLFYFDSAGYLLKGVKPLSFLLPDPDDPGPNTPHAASPDPAGPNAAGPDPAHPGATPAPPPLPDTAAGAPTAGTGSGAQAGGGGAATEPALRQIDGSHSAIYSLLLSVLVWLISPGAAVLFNALVTLALVWLAARVLQRCCAPAAALPPLVAIPILAAATTALPFYVAFLMPDIFTPVLIVAVALLTAFADRMTRLEIGFLLVMGWLATTSHLSHMAILLLLVPAAALGALVLHRRRWWLAPLLVAAILAPPVAMQKLFEFSVEHGSRPGGPRAEVVYKPFITARLIQDGPGLRFLETHCPDPAIASCALWEALGWSDDPYRLTASHIIFEKSPELGSFQLMTPQDRSRVAGEQIRFFTLVLADMPLATIRAFLTNTLVQAGMTSIDMTLPDAVVFRFFALSPLDRLGFEPGRLRAGAEWIPALARIHAAIYAASILALAGLLIAPRGLPAPARIFGAMILAGILANALVCGGISQPATRYGARVAWLLPLTAVLLLLIRLQLRLERRRPG